MSSMVYGNIGFGLVRYFSPIENVIISLLIHPQSEVGLDDNVTLLCTDFRQNHIAMM